MPSRLLTAVLLLAATQAVAANVLDFGAKPDDGKDDRQAIQKAIDAGDVFFPRGTFDAKSQLILKSGSLSGRGAVLNCKGLLVEPGASVSLEGLTIDASGHTFALKATNGRVRVTDVEFRGPIKAGFLIDLDGEVVAAIDGCSFSDTMHGVRFRGPVDGRIANCSFTDWLHYAVSVEGTKEAGPEVTVEGNDFHAPKPGKGGARQMIVLHNPAKVANIVGAKILNNHCLGPGWYYDRTSSDSPGTADQIKISYAVDFVVSGNTSTGGGENGMSVETDSSRGVVSNNIFSGHDGHGLQIGARNNTPETSVSDVVVTGNLCVNNGVGDDPAARKTMCGIYVQDAARIAIHGNQIVDNRTPRRLWSGISIAESVNISLGVNAVDFAAPFAGGHEVAVFASTLTKPLEVYQPDKPATIKTGSFNLTDYGARGDGVTDDTVAIQLAINSGKPVFCPNGKYKITAELKLVDGCVLYSENAAFFFQNTGNAPLTGECVELYYAGAGGANSCMVRASKKAVGTKPVYKSDESETLRAAGIRGIHLNGNNLAEYGLYSARAGLGSTYDNISVTGTKKHGVWMGELWNCRIGTIMALHNYGCGISIGMDTFGWSRGNTVNGINVDALISYANGRDLASWTTADYLLGYGVGYAPGRACLVHYIDAEHNNGVGLAWSPTSGPQQITCLYEENNCRIADSSNRWGVWFQNTAGASNATLVNSYHMFAGAVGNTNAPRIRLTGPSPGVSSSTAGILGPRFGSVNGGVVFDADWGDYRVERYAMTKTTRFVSHYPEVKP